MFWYARVHFYRVSHRDTAVHIASNASKGIHKELPVVAMHCGVVAMWEAVVAMHSAVVMHCILGFLQWLLWVRFFWFDSFRSFELKRFLHSVDMWLTVARCIRKSACSDTYWKFGGKSAIHFSLHLSLGLQSLDVHVLNIYIHIQARSHSVSYIQH